MTYPLWQVFLAFGFGVLVGAVVMRFVSMWENAPEVDEDGNL